VGGERRRRKERTIHEVQVLAQRLRETAVTALGREAGVISAGEGQARRQLARRQLAHRQLACRQLACRGARAGSGFGCAGGWACSAGRES